MQTELCVFRHPRLKMRKEAFGGIVRSESGFFLVGQKEFDFLQKFKKYQTKKQVISSISADSLKLLLHAGILLEIDEKIAKNILQEKGGDLRNEPSSN